MFVVNSAYHGAKGIKLYTRKRKSQDTTKITSASADARINFSWKIMSCLVRTLCLCLVLTSIFFTISPFFSHLGDHVIISTEWCSQSEQKDTKCWAAPWELLLWSSGILPTRHSPRVWWGGYEASAKMTILIPHPQLAWVNLLEEREIHSRYESPSKMMKTGSRWREVTCLHHCLSGLPIREFEKINHYKNPIRSRTRCTVPLLTTIFHKHGLIMADLSSHNLCEKQVRLLDFSTYPRTSVAFFSTMWVISNGRVTFGDQRTWTSLLPKVKSPISQICHFFREFWEK